MAQPAYLITPNFFRNASVDDVQDILDNLGTLLPAIGWTNPATDTYQTPADPAGRYYKVAFARTSATRLSGTLTDDQSRSTATRCFDISGTVPIEYYYGTRYLHVYNVPGGEGIWSSLLSLSPESETAHDRYCAFFGSRTSAGTVNTNTAECASVVGMSNTYDDQAQRFTALSRASYHVTPSLAQAYAGGRRWFPCWNYGRSASGEYKLRGRLYNALYTSPVLVGTGSQEPIPLDESTTGLYVATPIPPGLTFGCKMAMRKS